MPHCTHTSWANFAQLHRASIAPTSMYLLNRSTFLSSMDRCFLSNLPKLLVGSLFKSPHFSMLFVQLAQTELHILFKSHHFSIFFVQLAQTELHILLNSHHFLMLFRQLAQTKLHNYSTSSALIWFQKNYATRKIRRTMPHESGGYFIRFY